jgi:hypothetical protein
MPFSFPCWWELRTIFRAVLLPTCNPWWESMVLVSRRVHCSKIWSKGHGDTTN